MKHRRATEQDSASDRQEAQRRRGESSEERAPAGATKRDRVELAARLRWLAEAIVAGQVDPTGFNLRGNVTPVPGAEPDAEGKVASVPTGEFHMLVAFYDPGQDGRRERPAVAVAKAEVLTLAGPA